MGVVTHIYNPKPEEAKTGGTLGFTGQSAQPNQ